MKKSVKNLKKEKGDPEFHIYSFGTFLKVTPDVPDDLIDGIFAGEGNALDHGQYRAGKFWWIALKILALCTGTKLLGKFEVYKRARVVYFGEEDSAARVKERLVGLCNGLGIKVATIDKHLYIAARQGLSFDKDDHRVWIRREIQRIKPDAIVIDPLRGVTYSGDGGASEIHDFFRFIRELQNTSVKRSQKSMVVQIVHHDRKNDTLVDSRAASGVIADKCEVIHQVTRVRSEKYIDSTSKRQVLDLWFGITLQDYKFDIPNLRDAQGDYDFGVHIRTEKQLGYSQTSKRFRWRTYTSTAEFVSVDQLLNRDTSNNELSDAVLAACKQDEWTKVGTILAAAKSAKLTKRIVNGRTLANRVNDELFRLKTAGRVQWNGKKRKHAAYLLKPTSAGTTVVPTDAAGVPLDTAAVLRQQMAVVNAAQT